jgi:hypothetical protein
MVAMLALVVAAVTLAVVTFRLSSAVWPVCLFFMTVVLHLYGLVLARGETLVHAASSLLAISAVWLLEHLVAMPIRLRALLIGVVAGYVLYSLVAPHRYLKSARPVAARFVGAGVTAAALWGAWTACLEEGYAGHRTVQIGALVLFLVPFAIGLITTMTSGPESAGIVGGSPERRYFVAAIFVSFLAVLLAGSALIRLANEVLNTVLPGLLAVARPRSVTLSWDALRWPISALSMLTAVTFLAITGGRAIDEYRSDPRLGGSGKPLGVTVIADFLAQFARLIAIAAWDVAKNLYRVFLRAIRLWFLPLCVFFLLGFLALVVAAEYRQYNTFGAYFGPWSLWGAGVGLFVLTLGLCGVFFFFLVITERDLWRFLTGGQFFDVAVGASLLGAFLYFLLSIFSISLASVWTVFNHSGLNTATTAPMRIYWSNLMIAGATLPPLAAVLFVRPRRVRMVLLNGVTAVPLLLALLLGAAPVYRGVSLAAASARTPDIGDPARWSASLKSTCRRPDFALLGAAGAVECTSGNSGPNEVLYVWFPTLGPANDWYRRIAARQHVAANSGLCGKQLTAESSYGWRNKINGSVLCFTNSAGSWIVWTDQNQSVLVIAHRSDKNAAALNAWWFNPPNWLGTGLQP